MSVRASSFSIRVGPDDSVPGVRGYGAPRALDDHITIAGVDPHLAARAGHADGAIPARCGDVAARTGHVDASVSRLHLDSHGARELYGEVSCRRLAFVIITAVIVLAESVGRAHRPIGPPCTDRDGIAVGHDIERDRPAAPSSATDIGVHHDAIARRGRHPNVAPHVRDAQAPASRDLPGPVERLVSGTARCLPAHGRGGHTAQHNAH